MRERILFSTDAFSTFKTLFGALYVNETDFNRGYLEETRRYYSNIVWKYGAKVQAVFKKLGGVPIDMICPLYRPIWRRDIPYIFGKYDLRSRYEPEEKGVVIGCMSIYDNTATVANRLALLLKERGVANITMYAITRMHPSYVVSDIFRFTNIVLATSTYNNALHLTVSAVIEDMKNMGDQNRRYSLIGNGSWAPLSLRYWTGSSCMPWPPRTVTA